MKFNKKNKVLISVAAILLLFIVLAGFIIGSRISTRIIPNGSISLSTQYSEYLVGDNINLTVVNNFNSTIYFDNNCPAEPLDVYRLEGNSWVKIHDTADEKKCESDSEEGVPPNGSRDISFAAWPNLFNKPSKYRIVAHVDYYEQLPFTEFEIFARPKIPEIPKIASLNSVSFNNTNSSPATSTNTQTTTNAPSNPALKSQTIKISQGTVAVRYDNNTIYVQSIVPTSGYTYEGGRSGREVEITFKGGGEEVKLELEVVNGKIVQEIESGD